MTEELKTNTCPKCESTSEEVLNMVERKRVGWYCLKCHFFEKAILRETILPFTIKKVHV